MDYQLEQWINAAAGNNPVMDAVMVALAKWSEVAFIALVLGWLLWGMWTRAAAERRSAFAALLAAGLALAVNQLISLAWSRPRPFAAHPGRVHLLLSHPTDASFPSDHVAAAVAIAVVLVAAHRRLGLITFLVALAVGYARVFVGDHYPGDVLGGVVVGLLSGAILLIDRAQAIISWADARAARGAGSLGLQWK